MGVTGSGPFAAGRSLGGASRDPVDLPPGRAFSILQGRREGDSVLLGLGFWPRQQCTCPGRGLARLSQLCDFSLSFP